jgi:hypothetical protein
MLPIYFFQIDEGMGKAVIVKKQAVSLREIMEKKSNLFILLYFTIFYFGINC